MRGPPGRERTYVPDISYVAKARLPSERHLHAAPDLAIEVLSPDQHMAHFLDKIQFYLLYGVRLVWVIDPPTRVVLVYRPDGTGARLRNGDELSGEDVVSGFHCRIIDLFPSPPSAGA